MGVAVTLENSWENTVRSSICSASACGRRPLQVLTAILRAQDHPFWLTLENSRILEANLWKVSLRVWLRRPRVGMQATRARACVCVSPASGDWNSEGTLGKRSLAFAPGIVRLSRPVQLTLNDTGLNCLGLWNCFSKHLYYFPSAVGSPLVLRMLKAHCVHPCSHSNREREHPQIWVSPGSAGTKPPWIPSRVRWSSGICLVLCYYCVFP